MNKIKVLSVTIIEYILVLFISAVAGFLLLMAAYKIPTDPVSQQISLQHMSQMGWDPLVNDRYEQYISHFDTFDPGVLNDNTDKIILEYSYGEPEGGLVHQAAYMYGYGRYWHGYVVILRILFKFINYFDLPLFNSMLQIFITMLLGILIYKKTGKISYSLAALSSYLLLMPIALAFSLQFSDVFYLSFIASIMIVAFPKLHKRKNLLMFFFCFGIITAYIDFFTYHLIVWAYPLCWYLITNEEDNLPVLRNRIFDVVSTALTWTAGYVGMYICKFIILYVICGPEAFNEGNIGEGFILMGTLSPEYMTIKQTYSRIGVLYTNWRHYMYPGFQYLIGAWGSFMIIAMIRNRFKVSIKSIPLFIVTLSSPVWHLVFYTHSAIHHSFTYRTYAASILAFILLICTSIETKKTDCSKKTQLRGFAVTAAGLIIGLILSGFAKENVLSMFGGDYEEHLVTQEDSLEYVFSPQYKNIRRIGVCVHPNNNTNGFIRLTITGGPDTYISDTPIVNYADSALSTNDINWNLDPDKEYIMSISVHDNEDGAFILMTKEGNMPLKEFKAGVMNGYSVGNTNPLAFITYFANAKTRKDTIFLSIIIALYVRVIFELLYGLSRKETIKSDQ